MAESPRWGEGHMGRMLHRGWDELRSIVANFFHGSNVVQPDYQYHTASPNATPAAPEKSAFAHAVEQSRQVPSAVHQQQQEQPHGHEQSRGHER